jgi:hypothetical protein
MSYQGKTACQVRDSDRQPVMAAVFVIVVIIAAGLGCTGGTILNPTHSWQPVIGDARNHHLTGSKPEIVALIQEGRSRGLSDLGLDLLRSRLRFLQLPACSL